jgi:lysozyme
MTTEARKLDLYGQNQLKVWEGLAGSNGKPALLAYRDSAGVWTIGWGHTHDVQPGDTCTEAQAQSYFDADLAPTEAAIQELVQVPLTDNQFAALVCFVFNVGVEAFKESTLLKKLNPPNSQYAAVPGQLAQWNEITNPVTHQKEVSQGLVNRRALETTLWLTPDAAIKPSQVIVADPVAPVLTRSDLRQVPSSSATPEPPPTRPTQTKSGQATIATVVTGTAGAIIQGADQAQHISNAISGALMGNASTSQYFVILSCVLAAASVGFAVYVYWRNHRQYGGSTS